MTFFAPTQTVRQWGNYSKNARVSQISTMVNKARSNPTCMLETYLCRLHAFASPEPQKNRREMCVPILAIEIVPGWLKFASVKCITLLSAHTHSSSQTTQPKCSLGREKACVGLVSCRSLRTNPKIDEKKQKKLVLLHMNCVQNTCTAFDLVW